nr:MAG TPA: hypothetical protein [Caudoviricetes sp.]
MNKLYEESDIQAIANGVRGITGETGTYTVAQMGSELNDYWGDFSPIAASTEDNGQPYNNGLGYKLGYRTNSEGLESVSEGSACTGFIPAVMGDTVRVNFVSPDFRPWYINMYDSGHIQIGIVPLTGQAMAFRTFELELLKEGTCYIRLSTGGISGAADVEKMRVKIIKVVSG